MSIVEEMDVVEGSSFEMQYGASDIARILVFLLNRYAANTFFKYTTANVSRIQDMIVFEEMRESACHYDVVRIYNLIVC